MMRRPPVAQQRNGLFLALLLVLPWLFVEAQQQPQHAQRQSNVEIEHEFRIAAAADKAAPRRRQHESPVEAGHDHDAAIRAHSAAVATTLTHTVETPVVRRKSTASTAEDNSDRTNSDLYNNYNTNNNNKIDEHALAILALDEDEDASSVGAPLPPRRGPLPHSSLRGKVGSAPQQITARSLGDWEVEDLVILATVDGGIYAHRRHSGEEVWNLKIERPMVEVTHHRSETSVLDDDYSPMDHYLWVVEPTQGGRLYVFVPNTGLVDLGITVKSIVEKSPYVTENPPVDYAGEKRTFNIVLDASTGQSLKYQSSAINSVNMVDSCLLPKGYGNLEDDGSRGTDECGASGTLKIGRIEYTVRISNEAGRDIATIQYWEWFANNIDEQTVRSYDVTMDNQYIATGPGGDAYWLDNERGPDSKPRYRHMFKSPVARVFDVLRPLGAPADSRPDLKVIPQPPMPFQDETDVLARTNNVHLDRTERGDWYALNGVSYPVFNRKAKAPMVQKLEGDLLLGLEDHSWESLDDDKRSELLIGNHVLNGGGRGFPKQFPTLPGVGGVRDGPGLADGTAEPDNASVVPLPPRQPAAPVDSAHIIVKLPQQFARNTMDFLTNPVAILVSLGIILFYQQHSLRRFYQEKKARWFGGESSPVSSPVPSPQLSMAIPDVKENEEEQDVKEDETKEETLKETQTSIKDEVKGKHKDEVPGEEVDEKTVKIQAEKEDEKPDVTVDGTGNVTGDETQDKEDSPASTTASDEIKDGPEDAEKKKKKNHRGRRGGAKHKKKGKGGANGEGASGNGEGASGDGDGNSNQSRGDEQPQKEINQVVENLKQMADQNAQIKNGMYTHNYTTINNNPQDVAGPMYQMGSLEVNEDKQLGTGSNGTIVFAGRWDGRDVAVKRMLIQFYDIASQETKLLRESDDHPNVIRYYAQQQRDAFLYIALELCQASLGDVIEKPHHFRELAQAGERDLPSVLYQITNGLNHLHELRIVHRDLKPQNILVNMGKDGRPRLLVSDFGLCKKLEDAKSSFGATTAHAAGTSGWRAPELLLDDDARDAGQLPVFNLQDASTQSGTSTGTINADGTPGHHRTATRAIDIFSLGLVFYYVLTKGSHPYDRGERYMREANIRKGNYDLGGLDILGEYAGEAREVITRMLDPNHKLRPSAHQVMCHPFFWNAKKRLAFLCDVSDHFEKEQRDPPSRALSILEGMADERDVVKGDFLLKLPREFVESLGKQRKYTGCRLLDLLRALRNKRNHYEDMSDSLKRMVGPLPDGYLAFWTSRFDELLITCWEVVKECGWQQTDRFKDYYDVAGL